MKNICIVGLGLIGGSLALALRKHRESLHILGVDISPENAEKALKLNLADEIVNLEQGVGRSDMVFLATPVDDLEKQILTVLDNISPKTVVVDFGSTKLPVCRSAAGHPRRGRLVASHPIAGTENSGPGAAFAGLFEGRMIIVCEKEKSDPDALNDFISLANNLNLKVEYMSAESHDLHIAYVSHLSHISSFALGATILEIEKNEKNIFIMAGSGFDSTVRLAKSSPDMWTPIFSQNGENIGKALDLYIENLLQFRKWLNENDKNAMHQYMKETNEIRRVLKYPEEGKEK